MATERKALQVEGAFKDGVTPGFRKMEQATAQSVARIEKQFTGLTKAATALVGAFSVRAIGNWVLGTAKATEAIGRLARTVGSSVRDVSALQFAFELATGSASKLESVLTSFSGKRLDALLGSKETAGAFERLGVSVEDLRSKGAVELFRQISAGVKKLGDDFGAAAPLQKIFEDNTRELLEVLGKGPGHFDKLLDAAQKAGAIYDQSEVEKARRFNQEWLKLTTTMESFGRSIAIGVLPQLTTLLERLNAITNAVPQAVRSLAELGVNQDAAETARRQAAFRDSGLPGSTVAALNDLINQAMQLRRAESTPLSFGTFDILGRQAEFARSLAQRTARGIGPMQAPPAPPGMNVTGPMMDWPPMPDDKFFEPKDFFSNFDKGIDEALGRWTDFKEAGLAAGNAIIDMGLGGLSEALTDVITGTKDAGEAFEEFGKRALKMITEIIAQLTVMAGIKAIGGGLLGLTFAEGGVMPGKMLGTKPMPRGTRFEAFADGGVATSPTLALFGEGGGRGEAFVPLDNRGAIPVTLRGGAGGGNVLVQFNIKSNDVRSFRSSIYEVRRDIEAIVLNAMERRNQFRRGMQELN